MYCHIVIEERAVTKLRHSKQHISVTMEIEMIYLYDSRCRKTLHVLLLRYLIWNLYSPINSILWILIIVNMMLVRKCEEKKEYCCPCLSDCLHVTPSHSAGSEQIYTFFFVWSTSSNFTKISQLAQNMHVNFQVHSLLTQWNKPCFRRLVSRFSPRWPGFNLRSVYVGFVVDRVVLGQDLSEYFGFLCQFLFHQLLNFSQLPCGADTMGHLQPLYQRALAHTSLRTKI
jgi:hypothetical protein